MKLHNLQERSEDKCELCENTEDLDAYLVSPRKEENEDNCAYLCETCRDQLEDPESIDPNHWRCLNESMWSEEAPVQVLAWRMLTHLADEGWPQDLLDMLFLDDDVQTWAESDSIDQEELPKHLDCNGVELDEGDTVTLTKDLDVKGSSITAKVGTPVRRIRLVSDNHEQIEGKVNDQQIVILTKFVKKSG